MVGGSSASDRVAIAATKGLLGSSRPSRNLPIVDMEMSKLLQEVRNLPENSIVLYVSFFQDSVGKKFLNATKALPIVTAVAFGLSWNVGHVFGTWHRWRGT